MLNKVTLIGNVGRDAQVQVLEGGQNIVNFNVCVNKTWKDKNGEKQKKDTWFSCSYFCKSSAVAAFILKGTLLYLEGEVEVRSYKSRTGEPAASLQVNVTEIKLLSSRQQSQPQAAPKSDLTQSQQEFLAGGEPIDESGLPF